MILVSGCKRSGTSMWMQVFEAAGLPVFGEKFPAAWEERIKRANPRGFFESAWRWGIPPHVPPVPFKYTAVKVFTPGVLVTHQKHLDRVIFCVRPFREHAASLTRLRQMEDEHLHKEAQRSTPHLEWWMYNFTAISDALRRRYVFNAVAYEKVLTHTEDTVTRALDWLAVPDLHVERAIKSVHPESRSNLDAPTPDGVPAWMAAIFDEFYDLILRERPLTAEFATHLNKLHKYMEPELKKDAERLANARATHGKAGR